MTLLKAKSPRTREKRFCTLNAWQGNVLSAVTEFSDGEPDKRIRTFSQSSHDDILSAVRLLSGIADSVTVIHASRGCAASSLYHHLISGNGRWMVTNLDERDTIMGADRKLGNAVREAHRRYRPRGAFYCIKPDCRDQQ